MYWRVVPGIGGRGARHPEELLEGTSEEVVVVGGVVVGDAAATEAEPDARGASCDKAKTLTSARNETAGTRRRETERARLS
jgi:hypothetical protein